jgi:hypothetical protein
MAPPETIGEAGLAEILAGKTCGDYIHRRKSLELSDIVYDCCSQETSAQHPLCPVLDFAQEGHIVARQF